MNGNWKFDHSSFDYIIECIKAITQVEAVQSQSKQIFNMATPQATAPAEPIHNPQSEGPIQGLYKKVKTYLPETQNQTIEKLDVNLNMVLGNCDKVVVNASNSLRNGVQNVRGLANSYTRKVLNQIGAQLDMVIDLLQEEDTPAAEAKPESTDLATLYKKSRKINGLVINKLFKLSKVALNLDYPEVFAQLAGRAFLEARVISSVAMKIAGDWLDQEWRSLSVNVRRTKGGIQFFLKNIRDPDYVKDEIQNKFNLVKKLAVKTYERGLAIKVDPESLKKDLFFVAVFIYETLIRIKNKPGEIIRKKITDSKALYNRVLTMYNQRKAIMMVPQLGPQIPDTIAH